MPTRVLCVETHPRYRDRWMRRCCLRTQHTTAANPYKAQPGGHNPLGRSWTGQTGRVALASTVWPTASASSSPSRSLKGATPQGQASVSGVKPQSYTRAWESLAHVRRNHLWFIMSETPPLPHPRRNATVLFRSCRMKPPATAGTALGMRNFFSTMLRQMVIWSPCWWSANGEDPTIISYVRMPMAQ